MINITDRIKALTKIIESGNCTPSDANDYRKQVQEMKSIVGWLNYQCTALYQAKYDNETKELQMKMKNTTKYRFRIVRFDITTEDSSHIPITVNDWSPNSTKTISFFHDFNYDYGYKTRKTIKLTIDSKSVEYDLYDANAYKHTGNDNEKRFIQPSRYSKTQGYLTIVRNFYSAVTEYDLKAKSRMLEDLIITIYDRVSIKPELITKIIKLEEIYLPTVCRSLDNYIDVIKKDAAGNNTNEIVKIARNNLDIAIVALTNLKEELYSSAILENTIDTIVMKSMMREEGLLK